MLRQRIASRLLARRLERGRGSVLPMNALVLAVEEDWPGGAGNALGTLYAYNNACKLAQAKFSYDVETKLKRGKLVWVSSTPLVRVRGWPHYQAQKTTTNPELNYLLRLRWM